MSQRQEQAKGHGRKKWPVTKRCELNSHSGSELIMSKLSYKFVPFFMLVYTIYVTLYILQSYAETG